MANFENDYTCGHRAPPVVARNYLLKTAEKLDPDLKGLKA